jgi:TonB family protein
MKYFIVPMLLCSVLHAGAQDINSRKSPGPAKTQDANGDRMPEAGYDLNIYLGQNLRYPDSARLNNIQGRVFLSFCVNEDGTISDCEVAKGIGGGCDEEAVRVMKNMPRWKPGIRKGKPVKVVLTVPIVFRMTADDIAGKKSAKEPAIYTYVDEMPVPGFDYNAYIVKNLHYPDSARVHNIQGKVMVKFAVNENGGIFNTAIISGIGGGCDEEALRVVKNMPRWKPGKQKGKPVKVWFTLPVNFKLQD